MFLKLLFETSVAHDLPCALEKIVIAEVNRHKLLLQGNQRSLQGMSLLEVINVFCSKNLTLLAVESISEMKIWGNENLRNEIWGKSICSLKFVHSHLSKLKCGMRSVFIVCKKL